MMMMMNQPEVEKNQPDCPIYIQYIESFFELIYSPICHLIETEVTIRHHTTCLQIYRQKRRSRVNYLLQPNLHFKTCKTCKEYVYKELLIIWFKCCCCELRQILPTPLIRLINTYHIEIPHIPSFFILTVFLVEKFNDERDLDISIIVYDMCKKSYIEKVKSYFFQ